jgi:hypothetical protein
MSVNKVKINISTLSGTTTATTINIPFRMEYQLVDQAELIQDVFVETEVEKAINPIIDYDKVRFLPINSNNQPIDKLIYNLDLLGNKNYASIGFTNNEIEAEFNSFKQTYLSLLFYDTDNALTQNLISSITLFSTLTQADLTPSGKPKSADEIGLTFIVENPIINPRGNAEGYYIYDYKSELEIDGFKYLYMRASFKNAKTGKNTNLMVKQEATTIDKLVNQLYTRYKLIRTNTGYYYQLDTTYNGNNVVGSNNVTTNSNSATINLYQINSL